MRYPMLHDCLKEMSLRLLGNFEKVLRLLSLKKRKFLCHDLGKVLCVYFVAVVFSLQELTK